ncbi:MAG: polysaccharide export protein [Deltaproteobacteria bacterium]|nr:polysaccharide export protein [Deltaproteobacteria bacterium]
MRVYRPVILLLLYLVAGCAWNKPQDQHRIIPEQQILSAGKSFSSDLGPGDVFEVKVFQEKDLSGVYRVSSAGKINFPLIGYVDVAGLTPSEVANKLAALLKKDYLRNPQVDVFVKEFNSKKIYVFGQVKKPGTFKYDNGMTIVQAITLAGGFTPVAAPNKTSVTRVMGKKEVRFTLAVEKIGEGTAKNFKLLPGDIIFVPESLF